MTIALWISIPIVSLLAYAAIAGRVYRWCVAQEWTYQDTLSESEHIVAVLWVFFAIGFAIWWPLRAAYRVGARTPKVKLPRAEVRK